MADDLILDISKKKKKVDGKKYFNTIESLSSMLDDTKIKILEHPATTKLLIGAKDSGKTHLVKVDEIYKMEKDPNASSIAARKYSTSAAKRLSASMAKTLVRIKQKGFAFKYSYKKSQNFMYRLSGSKQNMLENQSQEYVSFEDENGLAGIDVANGGYIATVHIEEPALKDDKGDTPTPTQWKGSIGVIKDSVNRTVRDYGDTNPFFPPSPTTWWITMNDWDEDHPESLYAEKHSPRDKFLAENLGGMSPEVLLGNKALILKHWDKIANALITKHTSIIYVKKDDKIVVRMTKFANPSIRENPELQKNILSSIQEALIDNDNFELARQMGMLYEGSDDDDFAYNIPDLNNQMIDTHQYIKKLQTKEDIIGAEFGQQYILSRSIMWDIDVNRRMTGTVTLITGHLYKPNPIAGSEVLMRNVRFVTLPQIEIPAYGRGVKGAKLEGYYKSIATVTKQLIDKYPMDRNVFGSHYTMDDDQGTFMNGTARYLDKILEQKHKVDLNFHIQVKTGKLHDTNARVLDTNTLLDEDVALIDKSNVDLKAFWEGVRKDAKGKRKEQGKYEKLADYANSYEGSMFPYIANGISDTLLGERFNEEEIIPVGDDDTDLLAKYSVANRTPISI